MFQIIEELGFTEADADEYAETAFIESEPRNTRELYDYLTTFIKNEYNQPIKLAYTSVCPGHNAPFEFVRDAVFERHRRQLALAPRNGSKSFFLSLISWYEHFFKGFLPWLYGKSDTPLKILDVGAVEQQAKAVFKMSSAIWRQPEFYKYFERAGFDGILKESITTPDGSETATTVATWSGVNSPHPPKLNMDEVDLWKEDIFKQALSMPKRAGRHSPAVRQTSTRKFSTGLMEKLISESSARGYKFYQWCIFECLEKCPRERDCRSCELYEWQDKEGGILCGGKAKNSTGYYKIDDFIEDVREKDRETIESDWLCQKPNREGLVFGRTYEERVHRAAFDIPYSARLPLTITIDQGWTNPFGVLYLQEDSANNQLRFISEDYVTKRLPKEVGQEIAEKLSLWRVSTDRVIDLIYDPEDPSGARTLANNIVTADGLTRYRVKLMRPRRVDVLSGLQYCRERLKYNVGELPRAVIGVSLKWLHYELTHYAYSTKETEHRALAEKPIDKDNHLVSAWYRYEIVKRFYSSAVEATSDPRGL